MTICKLEEKLPELEHLRFRDSDLSANGGAMLGFAGLMLASDLVFLSAPTESFIAPRPGLDAAGLYALFLLALAALFATLSITEPGRLRAEKFDKAGEFFWAVEQFLERRRRHLFWSKGLAGVGAAVFLFAIFLSSLDCFR